MIMHQNIKAQNVLIFENGNSGKLFELADYSAFGSLDEGDTALAIKPIECLKGKYNSPKGDVW